MIMKIHEMGVRNEDKFVVLHANTERLKKSVIPFMQRLLNNQEKRKMSINNEDYDEQERRAPG